MRTAAVLFVSVITLAGCTRAHYRRSADRETYPAIAERVVSPAYAVGRTRVEPDPPPRTPDPDDRSIDIRITRLRKKLELEPGQPTVIRTVRGEGYLYDPEPSGS